MSPVESCKLFGKLNQQLFFRTQSSTVLKLNEIKFYLIENKRLKIEFEAIRKFNKFHIIK